MEQIKVKFLGSGDAFGSGGRFQACIFIKSAAGRFLLDCGPSSLIAMRRFDVDPNEIEAILISHLHGDHFGGIPFFLLDAQIISKRSQTLVIAGPAGIEQRVKDASEALFSGSSEAQRNFPVEYLELTPGTAKKLKEIEINSFLAEHPSGAPALMFRIGLDGKTIAYTGDTGWNDNLIPTCQGADVVISEANFYEKTGNIHLDYQTMKAKKKELGFKKLIITHMGPGMLQKVEEIEDAHADDGKVFYI